VSTERSLGIQEQGPVGVLFIFQTEALSVPQCEYIATLLLIQNATKNLTSLDTA
jgi:hypothetical protein